MALTAWLALENELPQSVWLPGLPDSAELWVKCTQGSHIWNTSGSWTPVVQSFG